jgi:hypothetical protein
MRQTRFLWVVTLAGLAVFAWLWMHLGGTPAEVSRVDVRAARLLAIDAAKQVLALDLSSWTWRPLSSYSHPLRMWQARHASQPFDRFASPLQVRLAFDDPKARREITIAVGADGKVAAIRAGKPSRRAPIGTDIRVQDRMEFAARAFRYLAGSEASRFRPLPDNADRQEPRWTAEAPSQPPLEWQIAVRFEDENFREASLTHRIAEPYAKALAAQIHSFTDSSKVSLGIVIFFSSLFLFISYVLRWMRGHIHHRSALTAGAIMVGAGILGAIPNHLSFLGSNRELQRGMLVGIGWLTLCAIAIIGVGHEAARRNEWERWREMRLLLQRRWRARDIPAAVLRGFAWSGFLAAIPLAVAASGLFPGTELLWDSFYEQILSGVPATKVIFTPFDLYSLALFAGLLPVLTRTVRVRWIGIGIFVVASSIVSVLLTPFGSGISGAIAAAVGTVGAGLWIYQQYGLLTILAAAKMQALLLSTAMLLTAAAPGFVRSGTILAIATALYVCVFAVWLRYGRVEEPPDDDVLTGKLSHKERLKAEFGLAQQAQRRMLPDAAPEVPGFTLAGICEPARDVGGDLYDYFRFRDGRLGICVADVSGKGMPAALYMTLTKGVIAAAAPETADVATLTKHLNRHLHQACRRKMFVTAVIGSLDPQSGCWQFVRAGHNPILWLDRSTGEARYLRPAGLGLGMTGAAIFDRSLHLEQIQIQPGDALVLYSDGLTEAMNEKQELYGEERLKSVVERSVNGTASHLLDHIRSDIAAFTGTEPAHDDLTIVVLQAGSDAS